MKTIFPLFLVIFGGCVLGQDLGIKVEYEFRLKEYQSEPDNVKTVPMVLFQDNTRSWFLDANKFLRDSIQANHKDQSLNSTNIQDLVNTINSIPPTTYLREYKYDRNTEMESRFLTLGQDKYYFEQKYNTPDWKIEKEDSLIQGVSCTRATLSDFRGRNYVAWFSLEHSYSLGPLFFHGLPGLVFYLHDEKKEYELLLTDLSKRPFPADGFPLSQLIRLENRQEMLDTQTKYVESAVHRRRNRGYTVQREGVSDQDIEQRLRKRIKRFKEKDNPIELKDE